MIDLQRAIAGAIGAAVTGILVALSQLDWGAILGGLF